MFFYNDGCEVDFYVPEEKLAIQVSYSLRDEETRKREIDALTKLPQRLPCSKRLILTYDEEDSISDPHGTFEVMPAWNGCWSNYFKRQHVPVQGSERVWGRLLNIF